MKTFYCDHCGNLLFFENTQCLNCGHYLGFLPDLLSLSSLETAEGGLCRAVTPSAKDRLYRRCTNDQQHQICNWLMPANDADALARAVESLLANPARRRAMGEAGRRRAREDFSAGVIVPRYEELYRRVCRRGSFEPEPVA